MHCDISVPAHEHWLHPSYIYSVTARFAVFINCIRAARSWTAVKLHQNCSVWAGRLISSHRLFTELKMGKHFLAVFLFFFFLFLFQKCILRLVSRTAIQAADAVYSWTLNLLRKPWGEIPHLFCREKYWHSWATRTAFSYVRLNQIYAAHCALFIVLLCESVMSGEK